MRSSECNPGVILDRLEKQLHLPAQRGHVLVAADRLDVRDEHLQDAQQRGDHLRLSRRGLPELVEAVHRSARRLRHQRRRALPGE